MDRIRFKKKTKRKLFKKNQQANKKIIARTESVNRTTSNTMAKRKKNQQDKQRFTKHYTEN